MLKKIFPELNLLLYFLFSPSLNQNICVHYKNIREFIGIEISLKKMRVRRETIEQMSQVTSSKMQLSYDGVKYGMSK